MHKKLNCDIFVYSNTFLEQFSEGAWAEEDISKESLEQGLLFRPNSNVLYSEFRTQIYSGKKYCITLIDQENNMISWTDLTYSQASKLIDEKLNETYDNHLEYLKIHDMKDAITLAEYKIELDPKRDGK